MKKPPEIPLHRFFMCYSVQKAPLRPGYTIEISFHHPNKESSSCAKFTKNHKIFANRSAGKGKIVPLRENPFDIWPITQGGMTDG